MMALSEGDAAGAIHPHLIGVIDLRNGLAVHAVAGNREEYRVIDRPCCAAGDSLRLAYFYKSRGVAGLYVADLDAIVDRTDRSLEAVGALAGVGLPMWIDAGTAGIERAERGDYGGRTPYTLVIGTESVADWDEMRDLCASRCRGGDRPRAPSIAISLDLRDGRVLTRFGADHRPAIAWADAVAGMSVGELIVLDLATVGTGRGAGTAGLCRTITAMHPSGPRVISGGGIRDAADARALLDAGCRAVLTATWLQQTLT